MQEKERDYIYINHNNSKGDDLMKVWEHLKEECALGEEIEDQDVEIEIRGQTLIIKTQPEHGCLKQYLISKRDYSC